MKPLPSLLLAAIFSSAAVWPALPQGPVRVPWQTFIDRPHAGNLALAAGLC